MEEISPRLQKTVVSHIKEHVEYPATKAKLMKACSNMSDFTDAQKKWFEKNLPRKTYKNADEVTEALGW